MEVHRIATREAFHTEESLGRQAAMAPSASPSSLWKGRLRKVDRAWQSRKRPEARFLGQI